MSSEIYIDIEDAKQRLLGNMGLVVKMLQKFVDKPNLSELADAIEKSDYNTAALVAHTIKGVAANLSFKDLYNKAQLLETSLKEGQMDEALYSQVKDSLEKTIEAAQKVISEN